MRRLHTKRKLNENYSYPRSYLKIRGNDPIRCYDYNCPNVNEYYDAATKLIQQKQWALCDQCNHWWCFVCMHLNNTKSTVELVSNKNWRCPTCQQHGFNCPDDNRQWGKCEVCKKIGILFEKNEAAKVWKCEQCMCKKEDKSPLKKHHKLSSGAKRKLYFDNSNNNYEKDIVNVSFGSLSSEEENSVELENEEPAEKKVIDSGDNTQQHTEEEDDDSGDEENESYEDAYDQFYTEESEQSEQDRQEDEQKILQGSKFNNQGTKKQKKVRPNDYADEIGEDETDKTDNSTIDSEEEKKMLDEEFDHALLTYRKSILSDSESDEKESKPLPAISTNTLQMLKGDGGLNLGKMTSTGLWSYKIPDNVLQRVEKFTIQTDLWERLRCSQMHFRDFLTKIQEIRVQLYNTGKKPFDVLVNPFCDLNVKRHRINHGNTVGRGRSSNSLLNAQLYCSRKTDGCQMKATLLVKSDLQVEMLWTGSIIIHNTVSAKTAPISKEQREKIVEMLEDMPPIRAANKLKKSVPLQLWQTGYRSGHPSVLKLRRIMHDYNQQAFGDERDEAMQLLLLAVKQSLQVKTKLHSGIIQQISIWSKPFVMCFSETQIRVFHELKMHDIVYLDATGGIFRKSRKSLSYGRPVFIYEIVCRNPHETGSSLPIASMASAAHDTTTITYFLQSVFRAEREICGRNSRCPLVMCDMSLVILYSFLTACNQEDMKAYIRRCWRVVTGTAKKDDFCTFVHTCNSHIMKNAKALTKKYCTKETRKFGMFLIGLLIQCKSLDELAKLWIAIYNILNNEFITKKVETAHEYITKKLKDKDSSSGSNDDLLTKWRKGNSITEGIIKNKDDEKMHKKFNRQQELEAEEPSEDEYLINEKISPFANHLSEAVEASEREENIEECQQSMDKRNMYHCPDFCHHLFKNIISNIHLSSALLLGDLSRHGTSEAYESQKKFFKRISTANYRTICTNNRTQGIVEQTMWDLKWNRKAGYQKYTNLAFWALSYEKIMVQKCNTFFEDYLLLEQKKKSKGRKELEESFKKKSRNTRKGTYLQNTSIEFPLEKTKIKVNKPASSRKQSVAKKSAKKTDETENVNRQKQSMAQKSARKTRGQTTTANRQLDDQQLQNIATRTINYPALTRHLGNNHCWFNASIQLLHLTGITKYIFQCERQKLQELSWLIDQMVAMSNRSDLPDFDEESLTFDPTTEVVKYCKFLGKDIKIEDDPMDLLLFLLNFKEEICKEHGDSCAANNLFSLEESTQYKCDNNCTSDPVVTTAIYLNVVNVPAKKRVTIQDLWSNYEDETLGSGLCPKCNSHEVQRRVSRVLKSCGEFILLHICRTTISYDKRVPTVKKKDFRINLEKHFVKIPVGNTTETLELVGCIVHQGESFQTGHFYTIAWQKKKIILADDDVFVSDIPNVTQENEKGAIILILKKIPRKFTNESTYRSLCPIVSSEGSSDDDQTYDKTQSELLTIGHRDFVDVRPSAPPLTPTFTERTPSKVSHDSTNETKGVSVTKSAVNTCQLSSQPLYPIISEINFDNNNGSNVTGSFHTSTKITKEKKSMKLAEIKTKCSVEVEVVAELIKLIVPKLRDYKEFRSKRGSEIAQFVLGESNTLSKETCNKMWSYCNYIEDLICNDISPYFIYHFQTWFLNYLFCTQCNNFVPDGIADVTKICRVKMSDWKSVVIDCFKGCISDVKKRRYNFWMFICPICTSALDEKITIIKPAEFLLLECNEQIDPVKRFEVDVLIGLQPKTIEYEFMFSSSESKIYSSVALGKKFFIYQLVTPLDSGSLYQPANMPVLDLLGETNDYLQDSSRYAISLPPDHSKVNCKQTFKNLKDVHKTEQASEKRDILTKMLKESTSMDESSFNAYLQSLSFELKSNENCFHFETTQWYRTFLHNPLAIHKVIGYDAFRFVFFPLVSIEKHKIKYFGYLFDLKVKLVWYLNFLNERKTTEEIIHEWIPTAIMYQVNQLCHRGKFINWSEWKIVNCASDKMRNKMSFCSAENSGFILLQALKCVLLSVKFPEKSFLLRNSRQIVFHELVCGPLVAQKNQENSNPQHGFQTISNATFENIQERLQSSSTLDSFIANLNNPEMMYNAFMKTNLCHNELWRKTSNTERHRRFCTGARLKNVEDPLLWLPFIRNNLYESLVSSLNERLQKGFLVYYMAVSDELYKEDEQYLTLNSTAIASPPNAILLRRQIEIRQSAMDYINLVLLPEKIMYALVASLDQTYEIVNQFILKDFQSSNESSSVTEQRSSKRVAEILKNQSEINQVSEETLRKITKGEEIGIEKRSAGEKGFGVFAIKKFIPNEFIVEYKGDLITKKEGIKREKSYGAQNKCYMYYFKWNEHSFCLDATAESENLGRFINHSIKNQNSFAKVVPVQNKPRLCFFAKSAINIGEELLYDYGEKRAIVRNVLGWLKK